MHYNRGVQDLLTLRELLTRSAATEPLTPAILAPRCVPMTFAVLVTQVEEVGAALHSAGFGSSSRIAVALPQGPALATALLAVMSSAGCVPLNPTLRRAEILELLTATRADAVMCRRDDAIVAEAAAALGLPAIDVTPIDGMAGRFVVTAPWLRSTGGLDGPAPDDVALLLLTSGTTAKPKVVPLSQQKLVASALNIARHLQLTPADRSLVVMPLFHSHGLVGALLSSMAAAAGAVCVPGWDEGLFYDWVQEFQPTWYTATPPIHRRIIERGEEYRRKAPTHQFRFVRSTSAALPTEAIAQIEALFAAPLIESFGMTEWSQMVSNPPPPLTRKPGSVGLPTGVDLAILSADGSLVPSGETGQVAVRGTSLTTHYEGGAQADALGGQWFLTGDRGRLDDQGYLYLEGRVADAINRGGEKVSPFEVEKVLLAHPAVHDAVVFAVPHPSLGEDVAAAVVLRDAGVVAEAALRDFVSRTLSDVKAPSSILVVAEIPKSELGKIQRRQLHSLFARHFSPEPVAPATEVERSVASIVSAVLNRPGMSARENFFSAGGDSLSGIRVVTRINRHFGIKLPATALFRSPTITSLATEVARILDAAASIEDEVAALSDDEVAALLAAQDVKPDGTGKA